tara:strand:+ start:1748 stop:1936 length:189 start_codon:yes stop_codon:yes gene_type:complete
MYDPNLGFAVVAAVALFLPIFEFFLQTMEKKRKKGIHKKFLFTLLGLFFLCLQVESFFFLDF